MTLRFRSQRRNAVIVAWLVLTCVCALVESGAALLAPASAYAGVNLEPVGTVTVAQGTARVFRRADGRADLITVGTQIFQNDTIITRDDGMLRVRFVDKSMISIGVSTTLTIDEYVHQPAHKVRRSRLRLLLGKVRCLVTNVGQYKEKRFMINSQTAVTGVRGTDLIVWVLTPSETQVAGLDGRTQVASAGDPGQSVQLEGRVWTRVVRGKAPAVPMALTAAILSRFLQGLLEGLPTGVRPEDFSQGTVLLIETNWCRDKAGIPKDPYFNLKGTWGQKYDDQWAIKRVGFNADKTSAWHVEDGSKNPVTVAVIDTGLDWNHKDIAWKNIWHNPGEIPDNGKDDDGNGYVDDIIGWNFSDNNNKPWDQDGHGTFVAGIIAAAADNGVGIAGINRGARIMVLKALNDFGHTRAANLAEAIFYAADNGARVINISAGGKNLSQAEQDAVTYAYGKGAVIIVAAGNEAVDTKDYSPAGLQHVITVAATDTEDKRAKFSNWGEGVDIAAPGMDVLSLRARRTDLMRSIPEVKYEPGQAFVGEDKRYYRASGTSFAAPIVAGAASLILAKHPEYTNAQVERMLLTSARDIEVGGRDQFTGYGLLDALAALQANPDYFLEARIEAVQAVRQKKKIFIAVSGMVDGSSFKNATVSLGFGKEPDAWEKIFTVDKPQKGGQLGLIPTKHFKKPGAWTIRLQATDKKGARKESRATVNIQ